MEITIEGKRYRLIPIDDTDEALKKARELKSKYSDYNAISEEELRSRIIDIDSLTDEEYVLRQFAIWINWEKCYKAINEFKYNPYKSVEQLKESTLNNILEVYRKKTSIETGFFRILYSAGVTIDEEYYPANIKVLCVIESIECDLGSTDRDYLLPTDDD